ncbi:restriction endonuclease [Isoptericola sp. 4D.3]|uniref:Restriction endonuclease n=1 Tax=Isoptericola peretonis TaxID=2918523 RepID=A0ABT0J8Y1_9MICO|nr:restriction endonuclease [Isoptericola sp. 4D.3]
MVGAAQLSGYLLEETLAHLLQSSGYRLLGADDDSKSLVWAGNGLRVHGRGADHQADALGDLRLAVPFSLPIRLFVEAKNLASPIGLDVVRNAHGVVHDVNQFVPTTDNHIERLRQLRRVQYRYSIFSTSGFSRDAQKFALAHQISLVDLSGPNWGHLGQVLRGAAREAIEIIPNAQVSQMARHALRASLRAMEAVGRDDRPPVAPVSIPPLMGEWADRLARTLLTSESTSGDILLGFVDAPFILALRPDDTEAFYRFVERTSSPIRTQIVYDKRDPVGAGDWIVHSDEPGAFRLTFPLPGMLEELLIAVPDQEIPRFASLARRELMSTITVYVQGRPVQLEYQRSPSVRSVRVAQSAGETTELRRTLSRLTPWDQRLEPEAGVKDDGPLLGTWDPSAMEDLLAWLRQRGYVQEKLIRFAAQHGGSITRDQIYEEAGFDEDRTLRGLARPTLRARKELINQGRLPVDAKLPFAPVYASGPAASNYEVPREFTQFLAVTDGEF